MKNKISDEKLIRIALAATTKIHSTASECPSKKIMADFVGNRINKEQEVEMWEHIDQCSECYNIWKDKKSIQIKKNRIKARINRIIARIKAYFEKEQKIKYFNKPLIVPVAACFLIVFLGLGGHLYQKYINPEKFLLDPFFFDHQAETSKPIQETLQELDSLKPITMDYSAQINYPAFAQINYPT